MGDFIYHGEHSIDIRVEGDTLWANTWENWKLAPNVRPVVNPPEPKKEYVDVPGAHGSIDYTEALSAVRYQNRTGSWTFLIDNGYWDWPTLYTEFMTRYQGKKVEISLTDDPDYKYVGRIEVNQFNQNKDYSSFTINYTLEPFKIPKLSSYDVWWKWNELFAVPSFFGPLMVEGKVERHILNPSNDEAQEVRISTSERIMYDLYRYERYSTGNPNNPMSTKAVVEAKSVNVDSGEWEDPIFTLKPGEVKLIILYGTSYVRFDCGAGKRL